MRKQRERNQSNTPCLFIVFLNLFSALLLFLFFPCVDTPTVHSEEGGPRPIRFLPPSTRGRDCAGKRTTFARQLLNSTSEHSTLVCVFLLLTPSSLVECLSQWEWLREHSCRGLRVGRASVQLFSSSLASRALEDAPGDSILENRHRAIKEKENKINNRL